MKKLCELALFAFLVMSCQESLEDRCAREAKEYTKKNCPARLDSNTTLDSLTFEQATHTLHYFYKLTGKADQEGLLDSIQAAKALREELKNTTAMKIYKDNKYRFSYTFRSGRDSKKILYQVTLTDKDY